MENRKDIDFSKPIGPATRRWINTHGTAEQKKKLREQYFESLTQEQQANQRKFEASLSEPAAAPENNEPKRLDGCAARLYRTMKKRAAGPDTPPQDLYRAAKVLLWLAYVEQVEFETGTKPSMNGRQDVLTALHQVAHWLVGQESTRPDSLCDCEGMKVRLIPIRQSLYLYGGLGTGKSTIAIAASYASRQLSAEYNTGMRLEYTSLDEMMLSVSGSQSLKPIEDASKGSMVLDELRTEHLEYKHYGNQIRVLADILLVRHHTWKHIGAQTIITSNIPPAKLPELIGDDRVQSRLIQQYYPILIHGESMRVAQPVTENQIAAPAPAPKNEVA